MRRLQEYERFKQAALRVDEMPRLERDTWIASAEVGERRAVRVLPDVTLKELLIAFRDVAVRAEMFAHHHIHREPLSVRARMSDVLASVQGGNFVGHFVRKTGEAHLLKVPTANSRPYGIALDSKGRVWFNEFNSDKLGSVDPATMQFSEFKLPRAEARGRRIGITSDDRIWYVDYAKGFLGRFDPKTKEFKEHAMPSGAASRPYGMSVDDRDRIWIVESGVQPNKFVGFDPNITVGVWVGYDEKKPIGGTRNGETGATAALPIWMDFMRTYIDARGDRQNPPQFDAPGNIVFVTLVVAAAGVLTGLAINEDYQAKWVDDEKFADAQKMLDDIDADLRKNGAQSPYRGKNEEEQIAQYAAGDDAKADLALTEPEWETRQVQRERERLLRALTTAAGNQARAARALRMPRSTFISKLKKHGLL